MERAIGEVFTFGKVELIVVQQEDCCDCYFRTGKDKCSKNGIIQVVTIGYCSNMRKDKLPVIFKLNTK